MAAWINASALEPEARILDALKKCITRARVTKAEVIISNTLIKDGIAPQRREKYLKDATGGFIKDMAAWDIQAPTFESVIWGPLWSRVNKDGKGTAASSSAVVPKPKT